MTHYLHSYTLRACKQRDRLPPDLKAVVDQTVRRLTRHPEIGWYHEPVGDAPETWAIWAGSTLVVTYQLVTDPDQVVIVGVEPWRPALSDSVDARTPQRASTGCPAER